MFDDNAYTFEELVALEPQLRKQPDNVQLLAEFVNKSIRNRAGWEELESFSETGAFLNKHPILVGNKKFNHLKAKWTHDRNGFLEEYGKARHTLSRYKSQLKRAKDDQAASTVANAITDIQNKINQMQKIANEEANYNN